MGVINRSTRTPRSIIARSKKTHQNFKQWFHLEIRTQHSSKRTRQGQSRQLGHKFSNVYLGEKHINSLLVSMNFPDNDYMLKLAVDLKGHLSSDLSEHKWRQCSSQLISSSTHHTILSLPLITILLWSLNKTWIQIQILI